ncbi:hypothetical protein [Fulvivirga kasyanovii]|uniref:RHS repeat protein n=1 Tax=Fulvivirga kasyanovii TaxID=396812 RepID=A0ABW9RR97_9BACT|nr:hypothetical protein [Fulvivirga kasyanovii]MTI26503.1 hypothetical protein [Fulvivirga kasyanovii]
MLYRSEDTTNTEGRLLFSKTFNKEGKLAEKYYYIFWDVVSYDYTTTYQYNEDGQIIEETKIQRVLNLGKRDEKYINALGDDPINEKIFYFYDVNKRLGKKTKYIFGREGFDESQKPTVICEYFYDRAGQLIKETSETANGRVIFENYLLEYRYDGKGQLIKKHKTFTTDKHNKLPTRLTEYKYNGNGHLIEEVVMDNQNSSNSHHLKFEYNRAGKKLKTYSYDNSKNVWALTQSFSYDKNGRLILGDDETTFDFYENGLIKQELWKSENSDEVVNFITKYEFY